MPQNESLEKDDQALVQSILSLEENQQKCFSLTQNFSRSLTQDCTKLRLPCYSSLLWEVFSHLQKPQGYVASIGPATRTCADTGHKGLERLIQMPECVRTPDSFTD